MSIEIRKLSNGIPVLMDNIDSINTISLWSISLYRAYDV